MILVFHFADKNVICLVHTSSYKLSFCYKNNNQSWLHGEVFIATWIMYGSAFEIYATLVTMDFWNFSLLPSTTRKKSGAETGNLFICETISK